MPRRQGAKDRSGREAARDEAYLTVRGLTYRYGSGGGGVTDVSLTVPAGVMAAITGPSDSGKSTLLAALALTLTPTVHAYRIGGRDVLDPGCEAVVRGRGAGPRAGDDRGRRRSIRRAATRIRARRAPTVHDVDGDHAVVGERRARGVPLFSPGLRSGDPVDVRAYRSEMKRRVIRAGLPMYGLPPSWSGPRFVGGVRASEGRLFGIELAHGDPTSVDLPVVRVQTAVREQTCHELDLALGVGIGPVLRGRSPADPGTVTRIRSTSSLPWHDTTVRVDDVPVRVRVLRAEDVRADDAGQPGPHERPPDWVISGNLAALHADEVPPGRVVSLFVRGYGSPLHELEVVRVRDLEPYA